MFRSAPPPLQRGRVPDSPRGAGSNLRDRLREAGHADELQGQIEGRGSDGGGRGDDVRLLGPRGSEPRGRARSSPPEEVSGRAPLDPTARSSKPSPLKSPTAIAT